VHLRIYGITDQNGETINLARLDEDRTAPVEEIIIDGVLDKAGVVHRRNRLRMRAADPTGLAALAANLSPRKQAGR
jgi:hypothetical protein